jgi:hypothetical protein
MFMKALNILLSAVTLFSLTSTLAKADRGGGGGTGLQFDDHLILAHPYKLVGNKVEFSSELVQELNRAGKLLVRYGADYLSRKDQFSKLHEDAITGLETSAFIENYVRNWSWIGENFLVEYRFVNELPDYPECKQISHLVTLEPGAKPVQLACTIKYITWIKQDLFSKMNLREQAKTIIHERLHAYGNNDINADLFHEFIDDITEGLDLALDLYNAQIQGGRPILSESQVSLLTTMMRRIGQLKLNQGRQDSATLASISFDSFISKFKVTKRGGGLVSSLTAESAYIGAGSVAWAHIGDDAEIIDTSCYDPRPNRWIICEIGANAKISFVTLYSNQPDRNISLNVGANSHVSNFDAQLNTQKDEGRSREIYIGSNSWIENVYLVDMRGLVVGDHSTLKNMQVSSGSQSSFKIKNIGSGYPDIMFEYPILKLGSNTRFEGSPKGTMPYVVIFGSMFYSTLPSRMFPTLAIDSGSKIYFNRNPCESVSDLGGSVRVRGTTSVSNSKPLVGLCM